MGLIMAIVSDRNMRHMAPYGAKMAPLWRHMADHGAISAIWRHMAPLNGVGGDKNGAPPFFIWQKQEHAPYGGNGAKWRHMAPFPPYGLIFKWRHFYIMAALEMAHMLAPFKWRHMAPF